MISSLRAHRPRRPAAVLLGLALVLVGLTPTGTALAASPPLIPGESTGSDPDEATWEGITIPTEGVLPAEETHPSLYGGDDAVAIWRDRVAGEVPDPNGHYASRWAAIEADADRWAEDPVDASDDVKTKAAKATAFAWVVTGEQRYLAAAVANLEAAYDDIDPVDQYVATQMTNYAQAYDWVAADLDQTQDAAVRASVKRGADWLYEYLDDPGVRSHNHRSKAGAALGSWALSFSSDNDAQAYLDRSLENLNRVFRYMFTKDGIYRDGGGYYWVFSIINVTPFLWQYRHASGVDLFPRMQPAYQWQLETANPKGWTPNVEDGSYKATWLHTVAGAYADTATGLSDEASLGELFQWQFFASEWNPVRYPDDWTGARDQYYGWPDELVLYDSAIDEVAPDDATATRDLDAGPRGGATVFRSDWSYGDADTRYGYFNGVAMSNNHDHADGMQLVVEGENAVLARDNGYGPDKFGARDEWKGPQHHNVVTADGAAVGDPTPTRGFLSSETFGFAEKSATYHDDQEASHTRSVAFPGQEYFVVADRLRADSEKTWEMYWHGRGDLTGTVNRHTWTTEDGPWGDAARLHAFTLPSSTAADRVADKFNPYGTGRDVGFDDYPDPSTDVEDTTGLRMTETGASAEFLSVLVPGPADGAGPQSLDIGDENALAAEVRFADHTDVLVVPRADAPAEAGGVEAAGDLGWTRTAQGRLTGFAVHDGDRITADGTDLVSATASVTLSADVADPREHVIEVSDRAGPVTLDLAAPAGRDLASATLDGESVPATQDADRVAVTVPGGGHLVLAYGTVDSAPAAPQALTATARDGSVIVAWEEAATATGYRVTRSTDGGDEQVTDVDGPRWTDTDVTDGTTYTYRVRAVNEAGESGDSDPATATPQPAPPTAPEGLAARAYDSTVELSWLSVPGSERYEVLRGPQGGPLEVVAEVQEPGYVDKDVSNGTTYEYAVRAVGSAGAGPASDSVTARPFTTPPDMPTGLRADQQSGQVVLGWDAAGRAETYDVHRTTLGQEDTATVASGLSGTEWADEDTEPGDAYVYRVVAENSAGASEPSTSVAAAPGCTLTHRLPEDGSVIEAEQYTARSGEMTLVDDLDRFGGRKLRVPDGSEYKNNPDLWARFDLDVAAGGRYHLQVLGYGAEGSNDSVTVQVDDQVPFTMNLGTGEWEYRQSARPIDLTGGRHVLRILAREDGAEVDRFVLHPDSSIPDSVKFGGSTPAATPECGDGAGDPASPAPVGTALAEPGDGQVDLTWSGSRRAATYEVLRDGETVADGLTTTSWRDEGVTNGSEYSYRVVAVNDAGAAEPSPASGATPVPPPPGEVLQLDGQWNGRFPVLDWEPVHGADSYTVRRVEEGGSGEPQVVSRDRPATSFVDRQDTPEGPVCYTVAAVNLGGEGPLTEQFCLSP